MEGVDPQVVKEGRSEGVREVEVGIPGQGMFWEADECARCVRDVSWILFLSPPVLFFLLFSLVCMLLFEFGNSDILSCAIVHKPVYQQ